jgi:hypothetical protein
MGNEMVTNSQELMYPFFVIEFKVDTTGSLYVATNQSLGASFSCVQISEGLNSRLTHCQLQLISSEAFSIVMNGTDARLLVSWMEGVNYNTQKAKGFSLHEPKQFLDLRRYVLNIIDWGKNKRLTQIRTSLLELMEESRKKATEKAKAQSPPFDDSYNSRVKKVTH